MIEDTLTHGHVRCIMFAQDFRRIHQNEEQAECMLIKALELYSERGTYKVKKKSSMKVLLVFFLPLLGPG